MALTKVIANRATNPTATDALITFKLSDDDDDSRRVYLNSTKDNDGYVLLDISGLGPQKGSIVKTNNPLENRFTYNTTTLEARNLVFSIAVDERYSTDVTTISKLKNRLYKLFPIGENIYFEFTIVDELTGEKTKLYINGYVEAVESPMFVRQPLVTVSIICMKSLFVDSVMALYSGYIPNTKISKEIVLGGGGVTPFTYGTTFVVDYNGNVPAPLYVTTTASILLSNTTGRIRVSDSANDILDLYPTVQGANAFNKIEIMSSDGSRAVNFNTVAQGALSGLSSIDPVASTGWPKLYPGSNTIVFGFNPSTVAAGSMATIAYDTYYAGL